MRKQHEILFTLNGVEFYAGGIDISLLVPTPKKRKRKLRQEQKKARRKNRT